MLSRRAALKQLAVAGATVPLLGTRVGAAEAKSETGGKAAFAVGVATVTLKSLPLEEMLAAVKRVGLDTISLHRAHSPWENQAGQWLETAGKIRAAGITPRCCGVLYLKNDEAAMRRMLDYAKVLG